MFAPTPSAQHKASPVEMLRLKEGPPPGASPSRFEKELELRSLLEEASDLERRGHVMQSLAVRERALLVQYSQTLAEIDSAPNVKGNLNDPSVRPLVEAAVKRARSLVLQLNACAVRLFKSDDHDSAGQLLGAAVRICDSSDNYSYFFDHWEQRMELKATTYNNLGCMERRRGRLAVALQYLRQALELPSTPSAALHLNVSGVLAQLGRESEALYAARKAIAVADAPASSSDQQQQQQQQQATPPFPGLRAVARHNLATILEKSDLEEAVKVAAEAVQLAEEELGASSPTTVPIRQTFNRMQAVLLRRQQEDLLRQEQEREVEEKAMEAIAAEEARKAQQRNRRRGAGGRFGPVSALKPNAPPPRLKQQQQQQQQQPTNQQTEEEQKQQQQQEAAQGDSAQQRRPSASTTAAGDGRSSSNASPEPQDSAAAAAGSRSVLERQAEQDSFVVGRGAAGGAGDVGPRKQGGFVGAVRRVDDSRPGFQQQQQDESESGAAGDGSSSQNRRSPLEESARRSGSPNSADLDAASSTDTTSPTSASGGGMYSSRADRYTAAAHRIEQQRLKELRMQDARGGGGGKPSFISSQQHQQSVSAAANGTLGSRSVIRTQATEEAALTDVVNFLSHRLATLLRVEEGDTRRFAAARCIQCAMRVALAKNELSRRRETRILDMNRALMHEKAAAQIIMSFFLRLRERRRQHKVDRARAAEVRRRRHLAAVRIQNIGRVWRAKRILGRKKSQRILDDAAATIIQRQMRRVLAHTMVQRLRAARAEARYDRFGLERQHYAASVIVRAYRMHRARQRTLIERGDFAAALSRDWRALRNHNALKIQRLARGFLVRKQYGPTLVEKNKLRRNREFTRRRIDASKLLQAVGRAFLHVRREWHREYPTLRKELQARRWAARWNAACVIQRFARRLHAQATLAALRGERFMEQQRQNQGVLYLSSRQLDKLRRQEEEEQEQKEEQRQQA